MHREQYKRIVNFLQGLVLLAIETGIFAYVWYGKYADVIELPFFKRGNWAVIGMYALMAFLFTKIYSGYKIGYIRTMDTVYSNVIAMLCTNVVMYFQLVLISRHYYSASVMVLIMGIDVCVIILWTFACKRIYASIYPARNMIIIYDKYSPTFLMEKMNSRKDKYNVTKAISVNVGKEKLLEEISRYEAVVICDIEAVMRNFILKYCYKNSIRTYVTPRISDIIIIGSDEMHLFDTPLLLSRNQGLSIDQRFIKRAMDIIVSSVGIVIASPIMLICAIAIKAYDGGPVFYRQDRQTINGKIFRIYKFRSMIVDSEKNGARLAKKNDDRITPVGKVLRNLHFDELPQLFNVFVGDMSMVGPRPERPEICEQYMKEMPEFDFRLKVKAGLTGYAQVYGKYNTTPYDKLKLDLSYIQKQSILLDLKLMLLTFKIMFQKESSEGVENDQTTALKGKK